MATLNNDKENPQRKILEGLQLKKQLILKQGVSQTLNNQSSSPQPMGWQTGTDGHIATNSPRINLVQATALSFGYFIPQDSSFGNFILPVLPRIDSKPPVFDIDNDALETCRKNIEMMELPSIDLVRADVLTLSESNWIKNFDTVILNPPFGTKGDKGIDVAFLKAALLLSTECVYSLHKSATRKYILRKANEWNVHCKVIATLRYNIPKMYKFHKRDSVDIEVDLIKFTHKIT